MNDSTPFLVRVHYNRPMWDTWREEGGDSKELQRQEELIYYVGEVSFAPENPGIGMNLDIFIPLEIAGPLLMSGSLLGIE